MTVGDALKDMAKNLSSFAAAGCNGPFVANEFTEYSARLWLVLAALSNQEDKVLDTEFD